MNTQVYNTLSGAKRYKQRADKCFPLSKTGQPISSSTSPSSSTLPLSISFTLSASSSTQTTLNHMGFTKCERFNDKDIIKLKDLLVKWICDDIRPFSVLNDSRFRDLAQELVRLDEKT